ncbi:MAG: glycosyltransferase 87 family protein [Flavobacteriales bacterium]
MNFIKSHRVFIMMVFLSILFYIDVAFNLQRANFSHLITVIGILFALTYYLIEKTNLSFWVLAGIGLLFRFLFLPSIPNLSQDFYRFIWDGRILLKGINPYLFTPESIIDTNSASSGLGSMMTQHININQSKELYQGMGQLNGSHFSNYPPINQLCFAMAALFSSKSIIGAALIFRLQIMLADLGILYFGRKLLKNLNQNPTKIFWYFLNPFIIIELTGNLHFEAVMLFFMIWSLYLLQQRKWLWAALLFGISISVKLIPLLFLPLFLFWFWNSENRKKGIASLLGFYTIVIATVLATFFPFYSLAFVTNFSKTIALWFQKFEFNASIYYIIRWIGFKIIGWNLIATVGKILPLISLLIILLLTFRRKNKIFQQLIISLLFSISFYYFFSTTVHPWYIATPLLLSLFTKYKFAVVWSFVVMLSYSAYQSNGFSENYMLITLEYLVVISCFLWEVFIKNSKKSLEKSIN